MTSTTADYPPPGVAASPVEVDALIATLDTWRDDRGNRLVELDESVQLHGSADDREAIALAFVLWKAIGACLADMEAAREGGRRDNRLAITTIVWRPVVDDTGAPLTANLPEAVRGVDDIWQHVQQVVDASESRIELTIGLRAGIEADLVVAERLSGLLGDEVRLVAELGQRLESLRSGRDDDDTEVADLTSLAAVVRRTTADLVASDAERSRLLDEFAGAATALETLRRSEAETRLLAERCRDRIAPPPKLAVPSVAALGAPPLDAASMPWPRARGVIEAYLERLDRVGRALEQATDAYRRPLVRRDELRGLVQAYRDKADAKGIAESEAVDAAYQAARGALWTAPCNVDIAERLVAAYQQLVNDAPRIADT